MSFHFKLLVFIIFGLTPMNAKPLRCFLPPSSTACESRGKSEEKGKESVKMVEVKEEASESEGPWMRLGLGIGATGSAPVNKQEEKMKLVEKKREYDCDDDHCGQSLLTEKQWCELQEQAIIYKYIASGLPVPLGLVAPIWKSVASSVGSVDGGIYRIYPSLFVLNSVVGFSPQGYDNKNMKDPEPLRCRRTDGKKWRCGKNVVTGQKYCERHMHRGRLRSRKLVEASQSNPSSDAMRPNSSSATCSVSNSSSSQIVTQKESVSHSVPSTSSYVVETKSNNTTMTADAVITKKSTGMTMNASSITNTSHWIKPSTSVVDTNNKSSGIDITNYPVDKRQNNFRCPVSSKNVLDRSRVNKNPKNFGSRKSKGMDFSPKSVLPVQGGCYRSSSLCQIDLEVEPWRCKRTDGKKWRCRRDAIANEKYCVMHMHRGAKKPAGTSQPASLAAGADVSTSTCPQPTQTVPKKTYCTYLNTNLSISVPASPASASNTSSDATISDTIIADNER